MGVLKPGDAGPEVAELQVRLAQLGHDVGRPDGKFGPRTERAIDGTYGPRAEEAVKVLQTKHGLAADGYVGPQTWQAVNSLVTG